MYYLGTNSIFDDIESFYYILHNKYVSGKFVSCINILHTTVNENKNGL